jgi:uncharacterized membrane protein YesL
LKSLSVSPPVRFLTWLLHLVMLNIITVLLCLPIFTAGAAVTALYKSLFDMLQDKNVTIKTYSDAFKSNFKHAFRLEMIFIAAAAIFCGYIYLLRLLLASGSFLPWASVVVLGLLVLFPLVYAFPLLSKFDNTVMQTLINALIMSTKNMGTSLSLIVLLGIPVAVYFISPIWFIKTWPLWAVFGLAFLAWLAARQLLQVFKKYAEI